MMIEEKILDIKLKEAQLKENGIRVPKLKTEEEL